MNKIIIALALCLFSAIAVADDSKKKWDAVDGAMFAGFVGLQVVDTVQTMEALQQGFRETNPLLGSHPTYPKLLLTKGLMTGGVYWLVKDMESANRKLVLGVLDVMYVGVVYHNYSIGVRVGF